MKPKAVIWDIDDVLVPTSHTFQQTAIETHGSCPHPDTWTDYLWGQHINTPEGYETAQYLIKHNVIERCVPYDYTQKALMITHSLGYNNILLSARSWHPDPKAATSDWAYLHYLDLFVANMHFVKVEESKRTMLEKLCKTYNIVAYVDDNASHIFSAVGLIPNLFLVRKGWNKDYHDSNLFDKVDTALEAAEKILLIS